MRRSSQLVKKVTHSDTAKSPSADCESKIGDMRGDFRAILLAKSLPYTNERPGGSPVVRPVSECNTSKKCLKHFFDTLRHSRREPAMPVWGINAHAGRWSA